MNRSPILPILVLFTLLFSLSLFGEEKEGDLAPPEPFATSLINMQSLLPTNVESVSTISGGWSTSETDFVVLGPEPLVLNRQYAGDQSHSVVMGYNWNFNRPQKLIVRSKRIGNEQHCKVKNSI